MNATDARTRFADELVMYDYRCGRDARPLVAAATDLLALGADDEALVALACKVVTPVTSPFEMDVLVTEARQMMRMPPLDATERAIRLVQAQLRNWERGDLSDRQLTEWTHTAVGHEGPRELHGLVVMDDRYDEYSLMLRVPEVLHSDLVEIAVNIASMTDPWG